MNNYIYGHTSPETAYLVKDYPYGFRLRTQIRYWLETTKQGDRFVSQTLNPKTGKWNKEKKSTYCKVGVMFLNEIGHVTWTGLHAGGYVDSQLAWATEVNAENFSDAQYEQLRKAVAFSKTMEYVTFECRSVEYRHKVTGEIVTQVPLTQLNQYEKVTDEERETESKRVEGRLGQIYAQELSRI